MNIKDVNIKYLQFEASQQCEQYKLDYHCHYY